MKYAMPEVVTCMPRRGYSNAILFRFARIPNQDIPTLRSAPSASRRGRSGNCSHARSTPLHARASQMPSLGALAHWARFASLAWLRVAQSAWSRPFPRLFRYGRCTSMARTAEALRFVVARGASSQSLRESSASSLTGRKSRGFVTRPH
jgi:hypothetical protein